MTTTLQYLGTKIEESTGYGFQLTIESSNDRVQQPSDYFIDTLVLKLTIPPEQREGFIKANKCTPENAARVRDEGTYFFWMYDTVDGRRNGYPAMSKAQTYFRKIGVPMNDEIVSALEQEMGKEISRHFSFSTLPDAPKPASATVETSTPKSVSPTSFSRHTVSPRPAIQQRRPVIATLPEDFEDDGTPKTAIIAEDESHRVAQIRKILTDAGYAILLETSSGEEAVDYCKTTMPTVVVTDFGLGVDLNGKSVLRLLRNQTALVLQSGVDFTDEEVRELGGPATRFVAKRNLNTQLADAVKASVADIRAIRRTNSEQPDVTR